MARELRVLVTIMQGEHRIHLRGDAGEVEAVANQSGGFFVNAGHGAGGRDTVRSGPETRVKDLWMTWVALQNGTGKHHDAVAKAFSHLKREARQQHLSDHPECADLWPAR